MILTYLPTDIHPPALDYAADDASNDLLAHQYLSAAHPDYLQRHLRLEHLSAAHTGKAYAKVLQTVNILNLARELKIPFVKNPAKATHFKPVEHNGTLVSISCHHLYAWIGWTPAVGEGHRTLTSRAEATAMAIRALTPEESAKHASLLAQLAIIIVHPFPTEFLPSSAQVLANPHLYKIEHAQLLAQSPNSLLGECRTTLKAIKAANDLKMAALATQM